MHGLRTGTADKHFMGSADGLIFEELANTSAFLSPRLGVHVRGGHMQ